MGDYTPCFTGHTGIGGSAQRMYVFENGYGASVIEGGIAYGGLEVAVLKIIDPAPNPSCGGRPTFELCYDTPITDDVLGYLDDAQVDALLGQISALPTWRAT